MGKYSKQTKYGCYAMLCAIHDLNTKCYIQLVDWVTKKQGWKVRNVRHRWIQISKTLTLAFIACLSWFQVFRAGSLDKPLKAQVHIPLDLEYSTKLKGRLYHHEFSKLRRWVPWSTWVGTWRLPWRIALPSWESRGPLMLIPLNLNKEIRSLGAARRCQFLFLPCHLSFTAMSLSIESSSSWERKLLHLYRNSSLNIIGSPNTLYCGVNVVICSPSIGPAEPNMIMVTRGHASITIRVLAASGLTHPFKKINKSEVMMVQMSNITTFAEPGVSSCIDAQTYLGSFNE